MCRSGVGAVVNGKAGVMAKALEYADGSGWLIVCPACGNGHKFERGRWTFNGDLNKPTFAPSMLVRCNPPDHPNYQPQAKSSVCHSFVRDGRIEFLGDCTHAMAGQTVELPDV